MGAPKTGIRAPKGIDIEQARKLAERQWTTRAIASFFGVSERLLSKKGLCQYLEECRHTGKNKIIDILYKAAIEKNDMRAAIHLANRFCGPITQKMEHSGPDGSAIITQGTVLLLPEKDIHKEETSK